MWKSKLLTALLLIPIYLPAKETIKKEELKNFKSNLGFEFQYPECFVPIVGDAEIESEVQDSVSIGLPPKTDICKAKLGAGLSFDISPVEHSKWLREAEKKISALPMTGRFSVLVVAKELDRNFFYYIETMNKDEIRVKGQIYCPNLRKKVDVFGPILKKGGLGFDKALSEAKNGRLEIPGPYREILTSLKCP